MGAATAAGLKFLGPLPPMATLVYGSRAALAQLAALPQVLDTFEMPAGLKRTHVDDICPGDGDGPLATHVLVVKGAPVPDLLRSAAPEPGPDMLGQVRWNASLTRGEAVALSRLPEVVYVSRQCTPGGPSDERSNRLIGGDWPTGAVDAPTYGSAWGDNAPTPRTLGTNDGAWNRFLSRLAIYVPGFNLGNQKIGFLDTGLGDGYPNTTPHTCPFYLNPASCSAIFTTDVTTNNGTANQAKDYWFHGTATSSRAAGFSTLGQDPLLYSFTQGVAQNARVAMAKIFRASTEPPTYRFLAGTQFTDTDFDRKLRYALIELGQTIVLEDQSVASPGVTLFSHSWNVGNANYGPSGRTMDIATRRMDKITPLVFNTTACSGVPNDYTCHGRNAPSLNVVAAGNGQSSQIPVEDPANAKNVIAVGAVKTYSTETAYPYQSWLGCFPHNEPSAVAGVPTAFSSEGSPTSGVIKPDLVAPGMRSYGARPSINPLLADVPPCNENLDPAHTRTVEWSYGTSFAAPLAAGAAAMVREWRRAVMGSDPSPALIKALLIASARDLYRPADGFPEHAPSVRQGWGGLALDRPFGPDDRYYMFDQVYLFTPGSSWWTMDVWVNDFTKPVVVALVWTDALAQENGSGGPALINDLDLDVRAGISPNMLWWYGNYYTLGNGFSTPVVNPDKSAPPPDHVNNVERITIDPVTLQALVPQGQSGVWLTLRVQARTLSGNALDPGAGSNWNQDFAVAVLNTAKP